MSSERDLTGKLIYAARLCRSLRAGMLVDHGLHAGQDMLLKSLSRKNGQTMGALAADLGVRPPTITKMVTRMEAQGLVRRETSGFDNRLALVHVTPAGEALLARIDDAWRKADSTAFEKLKDKDSRRLNKILDRILASFEGKDSQPRKEM